MTTNKCFGKWALALTFSFIIPSAIYGQSQDSSGFSRAFLEKLETKTGDKVNSLNRQLNKQTEKYLSKIQQKEEKIRVKLSKIDSTGTKQLFAKSKEKYASLLQKLQIEKGKSTYSLSGEYLPNIDSLQGSLAFLSQQNLGLSSVKGMGEKIGSSLGSVKELEAKLKDADQIKAYLKEREGELKQYLSKFTSLPKNITSQFQSINKEVFYYSQQVREFKEMFNSPDKLEKKALEILRKMPAFQNWMQQNGQLARIFGGAAPNASPTQGIPGIPSRAALALQITSLVGNGSNAINPQQLLQNQLQQAKPMLDKMKDKLNSLGGGSGDLSMPNFKPNNQKTKPFLKRLEFGFNIQSEKPNSLFPVTSDFALTMGYKFSDILTFGIGGSYKIGWGADIGHIHLSQQGLGIRTYGETKLKGNIWITGGYEKNLVIEVPQLNSNASIWQESGLIGLSKKYQIGKKKGNLQLLWDFLSYKQSPVSTPPIKFRIGFML